MPQKTKRRTRRRTKNTRRTPSRTRARTAPTHHFYSKTVFDGQNMITESKKDNEPVQRRIYTMKQLEREIPIGAELLKNENIHTVPKALQYPIPREIGFKSVLPNPADLGLLPPTMTRRASHHRHHGRHGRHRHGHRHDNEKNLELIVQEKDSDNDPPRNLFDIPI